jgi:hypothetical protein
MNSSTAARNGEEGGRSLRFEKVDELLSGLLFLWCK